MILNIFVAYCPENGSFHFVVIQIYYILNIINGIAIYGFFSILNSFRVSFCTASVYSIHISVPKKIHINSNNNKIPSKINIVQKQIQIIIHPITQIYPLFACFWLIYFSIYLIYGHRTQIHSDKNVFR